MEKEEKNIYDVAEAVVVTSAMNDYIVKVAGVYTNHEDEQYKATMQFLGIVFKKFQRIAQTQVEIDIYGNFVVKKQQDIRKDFNAN